MGHGSRDNAVWTSTNDKLAVRGSKQLRGDIQPYDSLNFLLLALYKAS